jgi:hypothetical protein
MILWVLMSFAPASFKEIRGVDNRLLLAQEPLTNDYDLWLKACGQDQPPSVESEGVATPPFLCGFSSETLRRRQLLASVSIGRPWSRLFEGYPDVTARYALSRVLGEVILSQDQTPPNNGQKSSIPPGALNIFVDAGSRAFRNNAYSIIMNSARLAEAPFEGVDCLEDGKQWLLDEETGLCARVSRPAQYTDRLLGMVARSMDGDKDAARNALSNDTVQLQPYLVASLLSK